MAHTNRKSHGDVVLEVSVKDSHGSFTHLTNNALQLQFPHEIIIFHNTLENYQ